MLTNPRNVMLDI